MSENRQGSELEILVKLRKGHGWERLICVAKSIRGTRLELSGRLGASRMKALQRLASVPIEWTSELPGEVARLHCCEPGGLRQMLSLLQAEPAIESAHAAICGGQTCLDLSGLQGYSQDSLGLSFDYIHGIVGGYGSAVNVGVIDAGYNTSHLDLISVTPVGTVNDSDHGTSCLGIVAGSGVGLDGDGFGVKGMCKDANFYFFPASGANSVAQAVKNASTYTTPLDVIILPLQTSASLLPPEQQNQGDATQNAFLNIRNAVSKSSQPIVVVEAAGNGNKALEDQNAADGTQIWNTISSAFRDSGAVLTGAGNSPTPPTCTTPNNTSNANQFEKFSSSNYGERLNCQGWGQNVATCGGGNIYPGSATNDGSQCTYTPTGSCSIAITGYGPWTVPGSTCPDQSNNDYRCDFADTSAATPLAGAAAACLLGVVKNSSNGLPPLNPMQIRALLSAPGINTPQPSSDAQATPIGPLPNLEQIYLTLTQQSGLGKMFVRDYVGESPPTGSPASSCPTTGISPDICPRQSLYSNPQLSLSNWNTDSGQLLAPNAENYIYVRMENVGANGQLANAVLYQAGTLNDPSTWMPLTPLGNPPAMPDSSTPPQSPSQQIAIGQSIQFVEGIPFMYTAPASGTVNFVLVLFPYNCSAHSQDGQLCSLPPSISGDFASWVCSYYNLAWRQVSVD